MNLLDPETGALDLVYDFSSAGNAIQGIAQVRPDVFVVNVLTCDIAGTLACTPGSVTTWIVDFCHRGRRGPSSSGKEAAVRRIAAFPDAGFLNGIAALDAETVLMADSYLGGVWMLDLSAGDRELLFTDPSMNGRDGEDSQWDQRSSCPSGVVAFHQFCEGIVQPYSSRS